MLRKVMIYLFFAGTAGGLLFGTPGLLSRFQEGHIPANYGSIVTWGLWVATYIYFVGLSAGSFLVSSLVFVFGIKRLEAIGRLALLTALVTLLMALISIGLDLGHLERAWHVYVWPNFGSPMAWMIWLYSTYMLLLCCEAYFLMRRDFFAGRGEAGLRGVINRVLSAGIDGASTEARDADLRIVRVLASIGVPLAIMFHGGVGALFGVLASRPMWHSGLYPVLFLVSAVVSGGAAITLLAYVFLDRDRNRGDILRFLGALVLGVLTFEVIWELAEIAVYMYGRMPSHVAAWELVLAGPYPYVFWVGQVGFGSLVPIVLLTIGLKRNWHGVIAAGCMFIAAAFLTVRLNMVIPALSVEEIRGLTDAYASPRWTSSYLPSLMEWQVTLFVVGLGGALLTLGWHLLPLHVTEKPAVGEGTSSMRSVERVS